MKITLSRPGGDQVGDHGSGQEDHGQQEAEKGRLNKKCLHFAVFGICDILVRIGIRGSVSLTKGSRDPDPTPFFSDFKDTKKKIIFFYNLPAGTLSSAFNLLL